MYLNPTPYLQFDSINANIIEIQQSDLQSVF